MVTFLLFSTTEHLLVLSAFLFPPVLFVVLLVIFLATFGKSLGLRERYVSILLRIFEWGAGEIDTKQRENLVNFHLGDDDVVSEVESDDQGLHDHDSSYCFSRSYSDIGVPQSPDSGVGDHPLARSISSASSLRNSKLNGSTTSLNSASSTRHRHNSGQSIIIRETAIHLDDEENLYPMVVSSRGWQVVRDSIYFMKAGIEAIIEDEVTSRFQAEQLAKWNLLTRTSISSYQFLSWKLAILWSLGFLFRYCFLLPMRLVIFHLALIFVIFGTAVIGLVPNSRFKRWLNEKCMLMCMRIGSRAFSALIYFHNQENKAKSGGICVANHTSPIDVMILGVDNVYAMIGQRHSGFMGVFQRALSRASSHIWFERAEAKDRASVSKILKEHIEDPNKLPVLIFPEGTCINNSAVMMFKKGCFEVGSKVYPIAMKYDSRFGDAFWNSSEQGYLEYMFRMMTSWALICHVYYLPPMERLPTEQSVDFAKRVQKAIATSGGLIDLEWDGQLKRSKVPPKYISLQRDKYYRYYQRYTSFSASDDFTNDSDDFDHGSTKREVSLPAL